MTSGNGRRAGQGQEGARKALEISRRLWLQGVGATALLAACAEVDPVFPGAGADAGGTDAAGLDGGALGGYDSALSEGGAVWKGVGLQPVTPTIDYYVTTAGATPNVNLETWTLEIRDRGKLLATVDRKILESLQPRQKEHTLACIGGGPKYPLVSNGIWSGLPLPELFAKLGITVPAGRTGVRIAALDKYTTAIPAADIQSPVWLVWQLNGAPLTPEHGYPARLLVPDRYGMKNPKWVSELDFIDEPYKGFWETQGWSDSAKYRACTYIFGPSAANFLAAGELQVYGTAFAGRDPIASVEVRVDDGPWQPATLDYRGGPDVWTLWHIPWEAGVGEHTVQARCLTESGAKSDPRPEGDGAWAAGYNGSMALIYTIR